MNYQNNLDQNNFYFDGFKVIKLNKSADHINNFLLKYDSVDLSADKDWLEKYEKTFDLKLEKYFECFYI